MNGLSGASSTTDDDSTPTDTSSDDDDFGIDWDNIWKTPGSASTTDTTTDDSASSTPADTTADDAAANTSTDTTVDPTPDDTASSTPTDTSADGGDSSSIDDLLNAIKGFSNGGTDTSTTDDPTPTDTSSDDDDFGIDWDNIWKTPSDGTTTDTSSDSTPTTGTTDPTDDDEGSMSSALGDIWGDSDDATGTTDPTGDDTPTTSTTDPTGDGDTTTPSTTENTADAAPLNQDTLTKGNVEALWDQGYQGQGMVVAVIDSGVQPHPDLKLTDDSTATITQADAEAAIAKLGYGTYINSKIPFAYDYTNNDSTNTGTSVGGSTHGEHVAGIIAANGSATDDVSGDYDLADYVKGVAPEAQILAMQVIDEFADENTNDISRAIRDAVALGANVIQMSLGIGVAEQDLTDEEQAAVKYATDHGVFVSISASNNGNAAAIYNPNTPYLDDVFTGYVPKNDSTVADPGAAASAMTVAAESSALGDESSMATFSSWGPMADYTLKPDISAPGVDVYSTTIDPTNETTGYEALSGTSMAGPFDAGAALLIMQKFHETRPELTGADLVKAVKIALMNAADPMLDSNTAIDGRSATDYVSPRRQGAGQIDVTKAANLTVQAVGTDDAGSVSLHTIGQSTTFAVTLTNYGDSAQTYTFSDNGGPETQVRDITNLVHDTRLAGATLTADTPSFTLAAGETKTINLTLAFTDDVAVDQIAEGFFSFVAADDSQTINMPYLGYYGDLTNEQVIDAAANTGDSIFNGGYLVDNNNNVLGIADPVALTAMVNANADGQTSWTTLGAKVVDGKVAFSPNGDGVSDTVYPYVFAKQNLKQVTVEILDANGDVVRTVDIENNTTKSYYPDGATYNADLGLSTTMRLDTDAFTWDGKIYDQATGQMVTAPDGEYTYRIASLQYNDGTQQAQDFDLPVAVDTQAPTITNLTYADGVVSFDYSDEGAGFTQYSQVALNLSGHEYTLAFTDPNATTMTITLTAAQQAALANGDGKLSVTLADVAGNSGTASIQAVAGNGTVTTPLSADNVVAPQLKWLLSPGVANRKGDDGSYIAVSGTRDVTLQAKVPAGVVYDVTATDQQSGKVYVGTLDTTTGIVSFDVEVTADSFSSDDFIGRATLNLGYGQTLSTNDEDPSNMFSIMYYEGLNAYTPSADATAEPFADNATVLAQEQAGGEGAPLLPGRAFDKITTHAEAVAGIDFDDFNNNTFTLIGADKLAGIYDEATGTLTITGRVDDPSATLTYTTAAAPEQTATIAADGSFSFQVASKAAEQQSVGFRLTSTAADGTTTTGYGELQIYLDDIFPTIDMPQADTLSVGADGDYEITTTNDTFTVAGTVDDNINGYRLYTNGDNIVHQKNLAGFNNHDDPTSTTSNPYGAEDFEQTYDLSDGDNYFTVTAVDMVGNTVTKVFHVTRVAPVVKAGDAVSVSAADYYDYTQADGSYKKTRHDGGVSVSADDYYDNSGISVKTQTGDALAVKNGSAPAVSVSAADYYDYTQADGSYKKTRHDGGTFVSAADYYDHRVAVDATNAEAPSGDAAPSNTGKPGTGAGQEGQAGQKQHAKTFKTKAEAQAAPADAATENAEAATYPATGDAKSPLAALGIALMSLLGLAGFAAKKKRA